MNTRINQLVRSLLQKDSLDQCSLPELQQFAGQNPYLGAAQLLLAKKMQAEKAEGFEDQLQKTLLYFHNPAWVEHLMDDTGEAVLIKSKKESKENEEPVAVQPLPEPETAESSNPAETIAAFDSEVEMTTTVIAPEIIADSALEPMVTNAESLASPALPEIEGKNSVETEAAADTNTGVTEIDEKVPEPEPVLENPAFQAAANDQPGQDLLFEPYHTVDYFASQGIKFREEEKPKDKFGQQLKSFTEWLKTLKKTPPAAISQLNEPASEDKVVKLAENSIRDEDVYTEAMAEVWEKQGNQAKAIDIYLKLSLLEPAKSTYFAAKIEELKKLN